MPLGEYDDGTMVALRIDELARSIGSLREVVYLQIEHIQKLTRSINELEIKIDAIDNNERIV